ncbi:MAG: UvrD-helicase domain-containing protein, partial [Clostridiales bacterium]|nr:UvrD-helicase domain-containing protein [Clostridiales bacterium]
MKSNLTESQMRSEIENRVDLNMFVEAGAGAGKTTLIVKRILNQLRNNRKPGEIVVITFTNAAAEELRGRIAEELKRADLSEALAHLDEMNISTIHSFCNVLLKEQAIMAGLPMNLTLMDETESMNLKKKYLTEFLSQLSSEDWEALEQDAAESEAGWLIKSYLEELYLQICDLTSDTEIVMPKKIVSASDFLEKFREFLPKLDLALLEAANAVNQGSNLTQKALAADEKLCGAKAKDYMKAREIEDVTQMEHEVLKALCSKRDFFKTSNLPAAYDRQKAEKYNAELAHMVKEQMDEISLYPMNLADKEMTIMDQLLCCERKERHFQMLVEYAKRARSYYYENRPCNLVSNDNILAMTGNLICNSDEAVAFFEKKYKCYYVDEFQDKDQVQASFIYRVASDLSEVNQSKLRDGA